MQNQHTAKKVLKIAQKSLLVSAIKTKCGNFGEVDCRNFKNVREGFPLNHLESDVKNCRSNLNQTTK